jgi:hypothetical protein
MGMKGIPDDTPENSVQAIIEILKEESAALGAKIEVVTQKQQVSVQVEIDISLGNEACRLVLTFVPFEALPMVAGTIGNGFLSGGKWDLELLPKDVLVSPHSPPFRWGLYPPNKHDARRTPQHILDGILLRKWLRYSLLPQLPSSPESTEDFC